MPSEDTIHALTAQLEAAHASYARGHAALVDTYRTATHLLSALALDLANPDLTGAAPDSAVDAIDLRLIALLGEGKKRHALHNDVGIGQREVRTRLERLYGMTGSQTQFQFGRACVSRLWLAADPGTPRPMP